MRLSVPDARELEVDIAKLVEDALEYMRPALAADGGDINLVDIDEGTGVVRVELVGACDGCPIADVTMTQGVERIIKARVPGVTAVVSVSDM